MNCPVCNTALTMTDRQGVEIDFCQKCRGVWLDRGELDKIIERSTDSQPRYSSDSRSSDSPRYEERSRDSSGHHDEHSYNHKKKKKESFLGNLFDF